MKYVFAICVVSYILSGCSFFDPTEPIPGFIYVDSLRFEADFSTEGTSSHNITEVWVYADGEMMGAYDLPASVPVLKNGDTKITILAGIKNNGISSTRIAYPFYRGYDEFVKITPGKTDTIRPDFAYKSGLKFWREEFDNSLGHKFENEAISDTSLVIINADEYPDQVFEGEGSGKIKLTSAMNRIRIRTTEDNFQLDPGNRAWVEVDYICNNSFAVGLHILGQGGGWTKHPALILNPTTNDQGIEEWNKIYIELTSLTASYQSAQHYDLYFECAKDEGNNEVELILDNIKVVQFDV